MFESTTSHFFVPNPLRRMAAVVAGAALSELAPQAVLIGGGESEMGFFYDFLLDSPPVPELATLVKEKMKGIFSKMPLFRETEMVVMSAAQLFQKKEHLGALGQLEELDPKALVSVVHLGEFVDLAEGPFSAQGKAYLDHFQVRCLDGEVYRLEGCVDSTQEELKAHIKKIIRYQKANHRVEGEQLGWWFIASEGIVWLTKGLTERRKLVTKLKEIFCADVPEVAALDELALIQWAKLKKKPSFWHWGEAPQHWDSESALFAEDSQNFFILETTDEEFVFESLLQSIGKLHTISAFRPSICLKGWKKGSGQLERRVRELGWEIQRGEGRGDPTLIGYAQDGLGRWQKLWELRCRKETNSFQLKLGVERILALLVEMNLGK